MKNNYQKHFEKELEIMKKNSKNNPNEDGKLIIEMFKKPIKQITKIFSKQGHSGSSASFYSSILSQGIKNILSFQPLSEITCSDREWNLVTEGNVNEEIYDLKKGVYQNNRCSAIFKEGKNGKPYYLDAIVWKGEDEYDTFTGIVDRISSNQSIKFPFTPKTFYIDVVKVKYNPKKHKDCFVGKDNKKYVYKIKDRKQLKEVSEYYLFQKIIERFIK